MQPGWEEDWVNRLGGERERQQARAQRMGMAFADLDRVRPDQAALGLVPAELSRELRALPVKRDGNTLGVALDDPDRAVIQRIKDATGLRVIPVMCVKDALDDALARLS